jgi:hypothetical protein
MPPEQCPGQRAVGAFLGREDKGAARALDGEDHAVGLEVAGERLPAVDDWLQAQLR